MHARHLGVAHAVTGLAAVLVAVIGNLGPCDDPEICPWDINGDGVVNGQDVGAVATHFGPCP